MTVQGRAVRGPSGVPRAAFGPGRRSHLGGEEGGGSPGQAGGYRGDVPHPVTGTRRAGGGGSGSCQRSADDPLLTAPPVHFSAAGGGLRDQARALTTVGFFCVSGSGWLRSVPRCTGAPASVRGGSSGVAISLVPSDVRAAEGWRAEGWPDAALAATCSAARCRQPSG